MGDAGNGVTTETFQEDSINNWNIQFPEWIPGFEKGYTPDMSIDYLYKSIARYYRFSKIAQFTTAWNWNQTFYYYLMASIDDPGLYETTLKANRRISNIEPQNVEGCIRYAQSFL